MPAKKNTAETPATETAPEKKGRKPGPARQTLLDAAEGEETVLRFDTPELAKGAAYGWWGSRRRPGLTEKVSISLNTTEKTVTIGSRIAELASSEPANDGSPGDEEVKDTPTPAETGDEATEAAPEPGDDE